MSERPILFSGPMVRAILEGHKTQTRRVVKYIPALGEPDNWCGILETVNRICMDYRRYSPYGQPGGLLWVRETWGEWFSDEIDLARYTKEGYAGSDARGTMRVCYRADGEIDDHPEFGRAIWRPSIHMPRWASRITLEITGVRVERLQDISEADAKTEGVYPQDFTGYEHADNPTLSASAYRHSYIETWESINGKGSWAANPWVWVIEFRRLVEGGEK